MIPILLIEDQVELCQILKDTLSLYGFDVTYAHNGEDGYKVFSSLNPKLVIIDIMMPGSDGFSAVKQIRAVNKEVPVIMLTAKPLTEDLVKAFRKHRGSEAFFSGLSKSIRKMMLQWIVLAKKPETRQQRIDQIAELAGKKMKPKQF